MSICVSVYLANLLVSKDLRTNYIILSLSIERDEDDCVCSVGLEH